MGTCSPSLWGIVVGENILGVRGPPHLKEVKVRVSPCVRRNKWVTVTFDFWSVPSPLEIVPYTMVKEGRGVCDLSFL